MKKISILGAGWLGTPLAIDLQVQGYTVLVSTTQEAKVSGLQEKELSAFQLSLNPEPTGTDWGKFLACNILVINIPPRIHLGEENHIEQVKALTALIKSQHISPDQVIYTSSTSVYPDGDQTYKEEDVTLENTGHKTIFRTEQFLKETFGKQLTIIRLGGLCGPQRNLGRFFAGKPDVKGGHHPVNMLHLEDAVGVISFVIAQNIKEEIFNACSPVHPVRQVFYTDLCRRSGMDVPVFNTGDMSSGKIISVEKLISRGYSFIYNDPVKFTYE